MRLPLLLPILMLLALPAQAAELTVRIDKNAYDPPVVTVKPGDTVVWVNAERRTSHDVIFEDGQRSERLMPEDSHRRTFDMPGRYPYHCEPHPHMKGEVIVEP
ncbi:MAG TPA: cupredoxin domain-containing protein [Azospirillum sp.]|nr:cupredoxin domain-containing protein [Azospirillum sp.]